MNPYKTHIQNFFQRNIELQHSMYEISETITKSMKDYKPNPKWNLKSFSQLVISDWSEQNDSGWEINNPTGNSKTINTENLQNEFKRIISSECCYTFTQTYESLETFIKDCIVTKNERDIQYGIFLNKKLKKVFSRNILRSNKEIFDCIKIACNPYFKEFSNSNNANINFKEFWDIISEVRHAVTHSSSKIEKQKIYKSQNHIILFKRLFTYEDVDNRYVAPVKMN